MLTVTAAGAVGAAGSGTAGETVGVAPAWVVVAPRQTNPAHATIAAAPTT
jgi:hypothetical protein